MNRLRTVAAWVCLVSLGPTCLVGCGSGSSGFDSPQACCLRIKESLERKDIGAFYDCLTGPSQDLVVGSMVAMKLISSMAAVGGPEAVERFAEVDATLQKHGVTDEAFQKAASLPGLMQNDPQAVVDLASLVEQKRQFVVDMFAAIDQSQAGGPGGGTLSDKLSIDGKLKDVAVNGDTATVTLDTPDGEERLDFHKTASGWKMHVDLDRLAAKAKSLQSAPAANPAAAVNPEAVLPPAVVDGDEAQAPQTPAAE